ncbi:aminoacyl-histidine dipeptidase [Oceanimonas sp. GK1]|uniref:aminoacyl-histidine dipeptidase n=1 Tax=Oceanimonas sp. (strain GK1 / IBRC-M 10197) TaxID=511062 RepID=UPI00024952AF|nr:aminoacyl-histidine dipeptidase [Oceanimonas sp. GK1]AEY00959.1 aminoacyl-histidine dipeptidase [Oceanimonas sp. GK1]
MTSIRTLAPASLWGFFDTICSIPHPSGHEAALRRWIADWAGERGLAVVQDDTGNLIIKKPASPGMEHRRGVVLQAHLDMVPQANADTAHDFTQDPIRPRIDGDWVCATGTTLGADNGIGMAACLAVLADNTLRHGPLEVLLTVDEESGMTGAFGLQPGLLAGDILLNTDSEQDGDVYMGCAGGVDANVTLPLETEPVPAGYQPFRLSLTGLRGGHSGINIHQGRASATKLLAELLHALTSHSQARLASLNGGTLRNAIAREAAALLLVPDAEVERLPALLEQYRQHYALEFAGVDDTIRLALNTAERPSRVMSATMQQKLVRALLACPHGVMAMSRTMASVVQTSTNLGVIETRDDHVHVQCLIRSLDDAGRDRVAAMTAAVFELAGARVQFDGAYPGWQPDPDSPVLGLVLDTHRRVFGSLPAVKVIHAGLECGLFKRAYPHWDMVSFGPTIQGAHSPDERVSIEAVERFWQLLVRVLEQIPVRVS